MICVWLVRICEKNSEKGTKIGRNKKRISEGGRKTGS
jgi:hypothetical protein